VSATTTTRKTKARKTKEIDSLHVHMQAIINEMSRETIGHDDAIVGAWLGLLSETNMMMVGPPGIGKSQISDGVMRRLPEQRKFMTQFNEYMTIDEVLGPIPFADLKDGHFARQREGVTKDGTPFVYLPGAQVAAIGELSRASGPLGGGMLSLFNEGYFFDGQTRIYTDLKFVLADMNFLPDEDEAWGAVMDRFVMRYMIRRIDAVETELRHLILTSGIMDDPTMLTNDQLDEMREQVAAVKVGGEVLDGVICQRLIPEIQKHSNSLFNACSDRRIHKAMKVMQAHAWLHGRDAVTAADAIIYKNVLWNEPHEIEAVNKLVHEHTGVLDLKLGGNTMPEELQSIYDLLMSRIDSAGDTDDAITEIMEATEVANSAINDIERDWTKALKNDPSMELELAKIQSARQLVAETMEAAVNNYAGV
jgi:MoxR-like ATPase